MKKKWIWMPVFLLLTIFWCEMKPVHAEVTNSTAYFQKDAALNKYIFSWLFEVDGGKYAFCIERSETIPNVGDETSEWVEIFNEEIRKILYYGYGGPADQGYTVVDTSCAVAEANGDNNTNIGKEVLEEIQAFDSPPENYRCWKLETNGGNTQDLVLLTSLTTGELRLEKISSDNSLTDNNPEYSLGNAEYGVFQEEACINQVATLVTDEDGMTDAVTLDEGTYYVKELKAPLGFELNNEVLPVNILVERTVVMTVADEPEITTFVLPNTGSSQMCLLWVMGTGCLMLGLIKEKEKKYEK